MNVLSKKIILFGIALFVMQNICSMDYHLLGKDIAYIDETYFKELEELQKQQDLEDKVLRFQQNKSARNPNGKTLPRTSHKAFDGSNLEKR